MFSCLFKEDISKFVKSGDIEEMGDYSLDSKNIERFINECDKEIRDIIRKIIDNTKYVNFMEFMRNFFKSVKDLNDELVKRDITRFYLYECKCKCNRWIFKYFLRMIKFLNSNVKIKIIDDSFVNFKEDNFIILPFDCLHTGFQITKNTKILCQNNKKRKRMDIYVLSPYMSSYGIFNMRNREMEREYHYKLHIGTHIKIDEYLISEILTLEEMNRLEKYYPVGDNGKFSVNYDNIYLFYFNHKLGDYNSTLTILYMGVVANRDNSHKLGNMIKRRLNYKEEGIRLGIIPLIKDCKYVYNYMNIDTQNPICPV